MRMRMGVELRHREAYWEEESWPTVPTTRSFWFSLNVHSHWSLHIHRYWYGEVRYSSDEIYILNNNHNFTACYKAFFLTVTSKRDNIPFVLTDFQIAQKLKPHWNTRLSTFTGGQGKKEKDVHFIWCFCLAQQQQSVQLHPFVLHGKGIFNTESHKTSNGIGRETTECSVINIKMPTNRQKKRRQKKSQQIYVHTHTHEEKSCQWIGEEAVMVGIDKPCIFTLW